MALAAAICVGLSFQAKAGDDLILPPDLRSVPPASPDPAPAPKPQKKVPPSKVNAKTDATRKPLAGTEKAETRTTDPKVEKPARKSQDDPVSFGMKWNADQTTGGPGSLSQELNKNVNGATVGTGAEVGFKYKF